MYEINTEKGDITPYTSQGSQAKGFTFERPFFVFLNLEIFLSQNHSQCLSICLF